jgi:muramidase (phage lysozyme)
MMSANLRAFLFLVRWAEGTSDDNGYRALYGHLRERPKLFDGWADHPRQAFKTPWGWTSAAGAFQFMAKVEGKVQTDTWDRAKHALGLPDFSPESQNKAALWLIEKRGALPAVEAGDLEQALARCSWEWASLPAGPGKPGRYGQPTRSFESCLVIFERAGGTLLTQAPSPDDSVAVSATGDPAPAPLPQPARPPSATVETPPSPAPAAPTIGERAMAIPALVTAAASALLPIIADLFRARGSKTGTRNAEIVDAVGEAAPAIVAIAKEVAGGGNEQQAAEAILASKALQAQFRAQVALKWSDVEPFLQFEETSRKAARDFAAGLMSDGPEWRQIGTAVIVATLSLIIIGGGGVLFWQMMDSPQLDPGQKGLVLGALIAAFGQAIGYWFGSSASSKQKDATIAEQAKR